MKHLLVLSAAIATLATLPAFAQTAQPGMDPAMPAEPSAAAQSPIVQANPPGEGMPTMTPPAPAYANEPVAPSIPADPDYLAGPYKGALTAPPVEAMNKVYPVCTRNLQDSCRNPGAQ